VRIPILIFAATLALVAVSDDADFTSPNKAFVIGTASDSHRSVFYAIQSTADGRTLATCPDDYRYNAVPGPVIWSADSRLVAIHTRETRHGGAADIWLLTGAKAEQIKAAFPEEDGNFYFKPTRWLNKTDLECQVIGILDAKRAPDRENPVKTYTLVMRVTPKHAPRNLSRLRRQLMATSEPLCPHKGERYFPAQVADANRTLRSIDLFGV
jgi:hypothetical protein